jgi:RNA-directed DNA polymerase
LDRGHAPAQQRELPVAERRGDAAVGASGGDTPGGDEGRMERVVARSNLHAALARVKRNGGSPGRDGRTVEGFPGSWREPWPQIREVLLAGTYRPPPVNRVEIPTPGGGVRTLGVPTVLERCIQPAVRQVLPPAWDTTCSASRSGCRPGRSAHPAVAQAQRYRGEGYGWVVDLDFETCFARVNHDQLRSVVTQRVADRRVVPRIDRNLKAGALTDAGLEATGEGTPWLANLRLDGLDKALERRGHRCVRAAADGHLDVTRVRAGQRVLASVTRVVERRLKLAVQAAKSAGERPWRRTCLGCTCTGRRPNRRRVRDKALKACQEEVRRRTCRTRGESLGRVGGARRRDREGWYTDVGCAEAPSRFKALDSWIRRRLRCYLGKPGERRRSRQLRRRGVRRDLAWNTVKSAHGPWRISRRPALAIALPGSYFDGLGWPRLHRGAHRELNPPNRRRRDPSVRWCGRGEVARPPPIPISFQ